MTSMRDEAADDEVLIIRTPIGISKLAIMNACPVIVFAIMLGRLIAIDRGHLQPPAGPGEGLDLGTPGDRGTLALIGLFALGMAAYSIWRGLFHRKNPYVFDPRTDQLRQGEKLLCRLSEIRDVRVVDWDNEGVSSYWPSLILADGRHIEFNRLLRFESREEALARKEQIEAFLKRSPIGSGKLAYVACDPPPAAGVWDRELDG